MKVTLLLGFAAVAAATPRPIGGDTKENSNNASSKCDLSFSPFKDVKFYLYTRKSKKPTQLWVGNDTLGEFDVTKPTKFLIHGFVSDGFSGNFPRLTKDEFLAHLDCNVIIVDWSRPASFISCYPQVALVVQPLGKYIAEMYRHLKKFGLDFNKIHCIGHSLGAHACGFSGKISSGRLGRVTGLDPARPGFEVNKVIGHLNSSDADFVDVIHTDGNLFGFHAPIGHADFYPNGGEDQPHKCFKESFGCDHSLAHEYFKESINSTKFVALECGSWRDFKAGKCNGNQKAVMGNLSNATTRGTFYLETSADAPFALG